MEAIAVMPGKRGARIVKRPEPAIRAEDEIKLQTVQVGICGTDREIYDGGRSRSEEGRNDLVIGHEMLGRVVEAGSAVTRLKPGDYAIFTVRRGCGECLPCRINRSDLCETGRYRERGILGRDGYQTGQVVDTEQYVIPVPEAISEIAVLCEPMSIAEKAVRETTRLQASRLPDTIANPDWPAGKHCLVAGLGPIGLLAAMILKLQGCVIYGLDIVDSGSARPAWLEKIGGTYLDGRVIAPDKVAGHIGHIDLIFDATGVAKLELDLLDALGRNGIYVLTGIPGGDHPLEIDGGALVRKLVMNNQVMIGSVNAAPGHFRMAVSDLYAAHLRWSELVRELITNRFRPDDFEEAFDRHRPGEIKAVVEWSD